MRKLTLGGAVAIAGIVGVAGSALTATSTIDKSTALAGSVVQTVSGVDIRSVVHSYNGLSDNTSAVSVVSEQLLSTVAGTMKFEINNSGVVNNCAAPVSTDVDADGNDDGASDFSTVTCTIAPPASLTSIRFIVGA